jgi:hypothetical protein
MRESQGASSSQRMQGVGGSVGLSLLPAFEKVHSHARTHFGREHIAQEIGDAFNYLIDWWSG